MVKAEAVDSRHPLTPEKKASVADIREALSQNPHVWLVGELSILRPDGGKDHFKARRDFYVEPKNPPAIPALSGRLVEALREAAFRKQQVSETTLMPLKTLAQEYNNVLRAMLPSNRFHGLLVPFEAQLTHLNFGMRVCWGAENLVAKVTTETKIEVYDEEQKKRFAVMGINLLHSHTHPVTEDIRVRLFPPGFGKEIYKFEKGFFVDFNVSGWDNEDLVYNGYYIYIDHLTLEQMQAVLRGELPLPEVKYIPQSEFPYKPNEVFDPLINNSRYSHLIGDDITSYTFLRVRPEIV